MWLSISFKKFFNTSVFLPLNKTDCEVMSKEIFTINKKSYLNPSQLVVCENIPLFSQIFYPPLIYCERTHLKSLNLPLFLL